MYWGLAGKRPILPWRTVHCPMLSESNAKFGTVVGIVGVYRVVQSVALFVPVYLNVNMEILDGSIAYCLGKCLRVFSRSL